MSLNGNEIAAEFILNLRWEELPPEVQERARLCLLDGLGCTLAGTLTPVSRIAAETADSLWGGQTSTIFLHGRYASPAGAAFANACAANALDIDDDAIFTRGHPGAQLIPAVLAVGERTGASGKEILEALVTGYEVAIRAGRCWHAHHTTYQSCGSWGSVACAAAAARLLGLNATEIQHALGIAEYHSPNAPMMRDISDPSMAKHAIGWGAMTGVTSAELAQCGYTGIPSLLGFEEYREWVSDLGQKYWMVEGVTYKGWASCAWGHAACQAAWQVVRNEQVKIDQIEQIRVRAFNEAVELYQDFPTTTEQAQFSVKWPLAGLLLDGEIGLTQVLEEHFQDPARRSLFEKIELILDPEIDQQYKDSMEMDISMTSRVEISLKDGRVLDSGLVERGLCSRDREGLESKFRWLVASVLDTKTIDKLIEMMRNFEGIESIDELTRALPSRPGA